MAITDRELSLNQKKLAEKYGSEILTLNDADQSFIINFGYISYFIKIGNVSINQAKTCPNKPWIK